MADTPGKYMIHTNIQGKPIKDMPKEVTCYPGADASKSIVEGPGVTGGYVNTDLPFTIRSMDKNGKPVPVGGDEYKVNVTAPDGSSFPVDVKDNGDGTYSGKYRPTKVGDYKVMVNLNNQKAPVGKSPYTAKVRLGADPGKSFAVGRGWKEAWDCLPAKFTVHCKDVNGNPVPGEIVRIIMKNVTPPGKKAEIDKELGGMDDYLRRRKVEKVQKVQAEMKKAALDSKREAESKGERAPEVRIEEGSDVPVEVRDNGDGTYLAQYVATQPGIYKCHVQVGEGRGHIKESPKDIPVYLSKPKVVFWKHTYDQQKKKLAAAEALLAKHGLSLGPDF
jgi:hypothetical protein